MPMFFDQTTKHVGSMNRYNMYSRDEDYIQQRKKIDETQPEYTLTGAMNQQVKQNTFR